MGRNLPPGVSIGDLPGSEPMPHPDDPDDPQNYGDEGECAVCGKPLGRPPEPGPQFCEDHDRDDLRAMEEHYEDVRNTEASVRRYQQG